MGFYGASNRTRMPLNCPHPDLCYMRAHYKDVIRFWAKLLRTPRVSLVKMAQCCKLLQSFERTGQFANHVVWLLWWDPALTDTSNTRCTLLFMTIILMQLSKWNFIKCVHQKVALWTQERILHLDDLWYSQHGDDRMDLSGCELSILFPCHSFPLS